MSNRVVSTAGRLPDFLIVGAAKSGTTTLYDYLRRHPQIFMSPVKEPEFFAVDLVYARGLDWYRSLFAGAGEEQFCGEASTAYTRWPQLPHAAPRIAETLPNTRLIYLMRHPIERAYSHYVHRITKELYPDQPVPWRFEVYIEQDPMCLDGSRYMEQIERYLKFYPRESCLFLLTEDLSKNPTETLRKVWRFLKVDDTLGSEMPLCRNETRAQREWQVRAHTTAPLRALSGAKKLASMLPQSWRDGVYRVLKHSPYGRWVERRYTPPPMFPETRRKLLQEFRAGNERLAEFLGRNLSHWST